MLERAEDKRYTVKWICLDSLVLEEHILRKIEKVIDFTELYLMVEYLYREDNGCPAADPVVLVKISLIQHLYGISSMRRTVSEIEMNIPYRWFLGYNIDTSIPHFATVSYVTPLKKATTTTTIFFIQSTLKNYVALAYHKNK